MLQLYEYTILSGAVMFQLKVSISNLDEQVLRSWFMVLVFELDLPRCRVDRLLVRGLYSSPASLQIRYPKGSKI